MYETYWLLRQRPFETFAEPAYFARIAGQHAVSEKLRYAVVDRPGFCLLTGLSGVGKTAITLDLIARCADKFEQVVWIDQPHFDMLSILQQIHRELPGTVESAETETSRQLPHPQQLLVEIRQELQDCRRPVLIVVDDCQTLTDANSLLLLKSLFEIPAVRSLRHADDGRKVSSGQSRPASRFVSVLLLGNQSSGAVLQRHPETLETLTMQLVLAPLTREETAAYLRHRLAAAGSQQQCFSDGGIDQLFRLTQGIPRRISQLADLALLVGYVRRAPLVTELEILQAARELMLIPLAA